MIKNSLFKITIPMILSCFLYLLPIGSNAQVLLDPVVQPKFVNPLPVPSKIDLRNNSNLITMEMDEVQQWLGLESPAGNPLNTTVWGYGMQGSNVTFPGPTFLAKENNGVNIRWENNLPPYNSNFPGLGRPSSSC